MKLRNKKTGEIKEYTHTVVSYHIPLEGGGYEIFTPSRVEEWEDYTPAEPLIRDHKIRKALKAWSKAEKVKKVFIFNLNVLGKNLIMITEGNNGGRKITFKGRLKIAEGFYTIAKLCGEDDNE